MDGILVVNKEKGYTSRDVVNKVSKILGTKKIGHTGTLDPLATGVLVLCIGKALKVVELLMDHDKEYIAKFKLGVDTDTLDITGKVLNVCDKKITKEEILDVLNKFQGLIKQEVPKYSAVKVNGKKLYEYALNNESVEIKPRKIIIYDIELLNIADEEIKFKVKCSKGTYIRTLCEDIAEKLDNLGYMKELERTKLDIFDIEKSFKLEELEKNKNDCKFIEEHLIKIEDVFKQNKSIILDEQNLNRFLNGVKLNIKKEDGIYKIYSEKNKFIGIGILNNNFLKRDLII